MLNPPNNRVTDQFFGADELIVLAPLGRPEPRKRGYADD
ncbi:hypothetical protein MB901379_01074 [Mycobacterium basiliense]|uniref:Uncharacterized protein n=1 Tax=Mycobacterium basiliense TaxID=2094119 RepID=A0A3S4FKY9_9MYCO|nr:hypothetical protein MB901379_01074 [Mycobacterium basiliense]